ncbi:Hsp70 ATPase ssc1 [Podospora fimiseda]|uniref:Hsp70 ATPase ssc1 n=1 Tax=Podospora fimiseda TaxID=252190 RepID=A0AAN7GU44_9PEZI|nr:Hsp70 ATPase ssc1 [Podospora fimiseda]
MNADKNAFLAYHEPEIVSILTLISFFLFLGVAEFIADKIFRTGLIGQIIVGLIYGVPIANILSVNWQETFLALGYIGLILIIFEGGLTIRLDLLFKNFFLSVVAALLGVLTPTALSFALLYVGFGHTALEAFIIGTALCSTSLGTTFVVISSASKDGQDFARTRIGTVLISAAVLDDVCGLVLVSVIHQLRGVADGESLGWIIGRPILASGLLAILTPLVAKFIAGPLFRKVIEARIKNAKQHRVVNMVVLLGFLAAFLTISAYAGASVLFGAFLAGAFVSSLRRCDEFNEDEAFTDTFNNYLGGAQKYILQPLFFASIGFAIPFADLWTGEVIWKGIVFTLLMILGKVIVGIVVPVWDLISAKRTQSDESKTSNDSTWRSSWAPATLLGTAMVARGEIGLLIIQIGLNETPFLSKKAFVIGVWAIILNTVIGPVSVGILLKRVGQQILDDKRWGVQDKNEDTDLKLPEETREDHHE